MRRPVWHLMTVAATTALTLALAGLSRPTAAQCVGDCSNTGQVTVNDILTGVNIAVNPALLTECNNLDFDGSMTITSDELLAAVYNALVGCAPQPWVLQNPTPTGDDLYAVSFVGTSTGFAVGTFGDILHTGDGGATWDLQNNPSDADLFGVQFIDANTGWAVGDVDATTGMGVILHTTDGTNWNPQTSNISDPVNAVAFVDTMHGWAVGGSGEIIRTTDGGDHWTEPQPPLTTQMLNGLSVVVDTQSGAYDGWAVGDLGTILHTADGNTWQAQTSPTDNNLYAVTFVDTMRGYAVGDGGVILRTTNGGSLWTLQPSGAVGTCSGGNLDGNVCSTSNDCEGSPCNLVSLSAVAFTDALHGWVVGDVNDATNMGTIAQTSDGGDTWTVQSSNNTNGLFAVAAFNSTTAWSVGGAGTRLNTTDGMTWQAQNPGTTNALFGIAFATSTVGYAVGDFTTIVHTSDGGNTWQSQAAQGVTADLFAVTSVDPFVAWVGGGNGTILLTTDGGVTWHQQTTNTTASLFGIKFINGNSGWAVGEVDDTSGMGTILHTDSGSDSSAVWAAQTSNVQQDLNAVAFVDQNGWAVGDVGTIVHTTDGSTWVAQNSKTPDDLYGVACASASVCWVVGGTFNAASETQVILYTTDGGQTWSPQSSSYEDTLFAVAAVDQNTAWAVGDFGLILGTTDGGNTWTLQNSNVFDPLNAVAFVGSRNGWTAGDSGTILGTVSGGR